MGVSCDPPTVDPGLPVVCFGLMPAVQRTLVIDCFQAGEVNRARATQVSVGGKAINAGVALALLGRASVVTGLNGGDTGRFVARTLDARGISRAFTPVPWPTRTCTTILDLATRSVTELVEEARLPSPEQLRRFERCGHILLCHAPMALICGALPPGIPQDYWARLAEAARRSQVPVLIDSSGAPLLQALSAAPMVAKMNVRELEMTTSATCQTEADILAAAQRLTVAGASWVLVTHGPKAAILTAADGEAWRLLPPAVETLSPIGSGDCATAGMAHAILNGMSMPDAARFGLACGSANARTSLPADFDPAGVGELFAACVAERIATE